MKRLAALGAFVFWAVALAAGLRARAQAPAPGNQPASDQDTFTLKVDASMVLEEVTVRDDKGRIADNLKQEDFHLFEDGVEQQITSFSRDELPLAVALVVDGSGSVSPMLNELHHAAYVTLSLLKPEDQVALYSFATQPERLVDLTTDKTSVADSIMAMGSGGGTNIADALYQSIAYLGQEARDRRHAVIMVSDNQPTARAEYTGSDVIRLALQTQTIVYSVRLGGIAVGESQDDPGWIPGARWVNKIMLETGGDIIDMSAAGSAQKAMAAVITRLKQRYTLGYHSSNTRNSRAFRGIEVRLSDRVQNSKHPYKIYARSGYYPAAEPAQ